VECRSQQTDLREPITPAIRRKTPEADPAVMEATAGAEIAAPGTEEPGLPAKFSDPDKTELTFKVPDGGTSSADVKLTSR